MFCFPSGVERPGADVTLKPREGNHEHAFACAVQLLVAAAMCLERPAAVPPQLLAMTASGRRPCSTLQSSKMPAFLCLLQLLS